MSKSTKKQRGSVGLQFVVGLWGAFLSIALHEAFHIYMHWGHIAHIEFFPSLTTIMQIDTALPAGYDIDGEETAAYGITLVVVLVTAAIIFRIRDHDDKRSPSQMLFPRDKKMQKMNPADVLKLSGLDNTWPVVKPARRTASKKK